MSQKLPDSPHIGTLLNAYIRKHRLYQSALARDIGKRPETVADFLKKPDNKISNLWKICFALNHNFFSDIAAQLPPEMPATPTAKDLRIAELEKQVQELKTERDNLQRVIDILRPK